MKRKLKSVWFNESENSVHHCAYGSDDSDAEETRNTTTWFSIDDLQSFKLASIKRALKIRAEHLRNPRQSYSNTLVHVYLQCLNGGTPSTGSVYKLSLLGLAHRRGLEFQSMEGRVRLERAKQRQHVRQAVVQEQLLSSGNVDTIRRVSERLSNCAKSFARALAEADAIALGRSGSLGSSTQVSSSDNQVPIVDPVAPPQKKNTTPVSLVDSLMITSADVRDDPQQADEIVPPVTSGTISLATTTEDVSVLNTICRNNATEAETSPMLQRAVVALC